MSDIHPEEKIHAITIKNFSKDKLEETDPELLEFCRCICCFCILFTDLPIKFCKWLISR